MDSSHQHPQQVETTLEQLQPDVLYHILLHLSQQDVASTKMASSRLQGNILRACQHWAPKVAAALASDPSSAELLQQLRGAGGQQVQPPAGLHSHSLDCEEDGCVQQPPAAARGSSKAPCLKKASPQQDETAAKKPSAAAEGSGGIPAARDLHLLGDEVVEESADSCSPRSTLPPARDSKRNRLDWRQVWSCLERAQSGPWQLDVRRLTPQAFPHGVLLTCELLLQQPAPPAEPGLREQQSGGWRDCVTVLSFTLDGKTVEITVDGTGRINSPQRDWGQGAIKLQPGQPKLLALEVSYLLPVPAWFLHPCTLAAPKLPSSGSNNSLASSGDTSGSCSLAASPDANWDSSSLGTSSAISTSSGGNSGGSSGSRSSSAHRAALCSAVSSLSGLSFSSSSGTGESSSSGTCGSSSSTSGRPRLCLDLSQGFGSYVTDPRFIDESARNQRPRGLERLELAGRVCWRPSKVQSWLGRLLPGIRVHGCSSSSTGSSSSGGSGGAISCHWQPSTSTTGSSSGGGGSTAASSGGGSSGGSAGGHSNALKRDNCRPSLAVTVSKAAVWQVPEDPEYRFMEGFEFWAVQHKAEQLLEHYGILPPWQARKAGPH